MAEVAEVLVRGLTVAEDVALEGAFLQFDKPLPVGTRVEVIVGDQVRDAVVKHVVERGESLSAGMEVDWDGQGKKVEKPKSKPKSKAKAKPTSKATKAEESPPMAVVGAFKTTRYGEELIAAPEKKKE